MLRVMSCNDAILYHVNISLVHTMGFQEFFCKCSTNILMVLHSLGISKIVEPGGYLQYPPSMFIDSNLLADRIDCLHHCFCMRLVVEFKFSVEPPGQVFPYIGPCRFCYG